VNSKERFYWMCKLNAPAALVMAYLGILVMLGCSESKQPAPRPLGASVPTTTQSSTGTWTLTSGSNGTAFTLSGAGSGVLTFSTSTLPATPPPTPTGLTATALGTTSISVTWNASSGATGYTLNRGSTQVYSGVAAQYIDNGLTPGTAYSYEVSASNNNGTSALSTSVSATTSTQPSPGWANAWPVQTRVVIPVQPGQADTTFFPLLVTLPQGYTGNGGDLAFASDSGGTLSSRLPCELVASSDSPVGKIWVQVPLLSGSLGTNAPQAYWILSGNPTQTSQPAGMAAQVWAAYSGVWHFAPAALVDSTSNANNNIMPSADYSGGTSASGPLGMCATQQPNGAGGAAAGAAYPMGCGSSSSLLLSSSFTLESLICMSSYPGGGTTPSPGAFSHFVAQENWDQGPDQPNWTWGTYCRTPTICSLCLQTNGNVIWNPSQPMGSCGMANLNLGQWYYCVVTFDGKNPAYYVNGVLDTNADCGPIYGYSPPAQNKIATTFGYAIMHDYVCALAGFIGETRIRTKTMAPPAEIAATANQIFAHNLQSAAKIRK
jgi:hypothetical protein